MKTKPVQLELLPKRTAPKTCYTKTEKWHALHNDRLARSKADRNPNWKGGNVDLICEECSTGFIVKPCRAKTARFCSMKCANIWQKNHPYPKQLWLKLINLTDKGYPTLWAKISKEIAKRDGYKCRSLLCNTSDHRIHVHHIDSNRANCSNVNLITVCPSCNQRAIKDKYMWNAILGAWNRWRCETGNFDLDRRGQVEINY